MKSTRSPHPSIKKLLDGLQQKKDDDVAVSTLKERALSRSANSDWYSERSI